MTRTTSSLAFLALSFILTPAISSAQTPIQDFQTGITNATAAWNTADLAAASCSSLDDLIYNIGYYQDLGYPGSVPSTAVWQSIKNGLDDIHAANALGIAAANASLGDFQVNPAQFEQQILTETTAINHNTTSSNNNTTSYNNIESGASLALIDLNLAFSAWWDNQNP